MMKVLGKIAKALCTWALAAALLPPAMAQPIPQLTLEELETQITQGKLGKIAVVAAEQGGALLYHNRFDGEAAAAPIDIRSAGKSITALAVGMAIADGQLAGTDVKVWPMLGADRGEPFASITVNDLLNMSSALDCDDWDKGSPGQEERMYRSRVWRDFVLGLGARDFARDSSGKGSFSYCTAGVFLLGQVVEAATGERFDTYVQRRLFDPLEITDVRWKRSRGGEIQSGGQLTISDQALLRIGRLVLDGGQWNGQRILPESWIKQMLVPTHQLGPHVYYGNLWWATPLRSARGYEAAWMMKGNGGNILAIVPEFDAVLLVQAENYNRSTAESATFTVLATLLASLTPLVPAIAE